MASAIRQMTGLGGDIRKIARLLQKKAPPGHMLAYINQEEADLLKARGGSGKPHADTGVPSFADDEESFYNKPFEDFGFQYARPASEFHPIPQGSSTELGSSSVAPLDVSSSSPFAAYERATTPDTARYFQENQAAEVPMTDASSGYYRPYYADPQGFTAPEQYAQYGAGRQAAESATAVDRIGAPKPDQDLLGKAADWFKSLQPETKQRLGIASIQGLLGAYQSQQAAEQGRQAKEEMQRMAQPYQQQGKELISKAQKGELSPVGQQQLQAVQAQAAQGAQARGGVGAQQAQAQVEAYRQQLLQGQYDYGLKVAGIGDQIMTGAIKTGMQADQYVNQLTSNYYNNIARAMYGQAPQVSGSQPASTSAGQ
jgi:hypothetical protein